MVMLIWAICILTSGLFTAIIIINNKLERTVGSNIIEVKYKINYEVIKQKIIWALIIVLLVFNLTMWGWVLIKKLMK